MRERYDAMIEQEGALKMNVENKGIGRLADTVAVAW